ncbi:GNAT family N-acetyltransferase [Salinibacterium sp. SWN1162]|uniref:GNAT family N-acetyltransferase n=1 Tax=Salinibacterium sp. SWN1162 TaxID=2792053 RepID=UPI0018CDE5E1|nr:GNAT family N-acetyltransferase [Salinibacterium sp. SWN1162]MBH0008248.1 GNAT family N-acetyltransferase [Salinibacterium sp. SWN1162]
MTPTLRDPVPADADALAQLHVASWRETYSHLLPEGFFTDEFLAKRQKMWTHILNNPSEELSIQLAEHAGSIIGFACVQRAPSTKQTGSSDDTELNAIYVLEAHHGSGVGQALLDATLGDSPASLWVAKNNPRAEAFYRRNGFEFTGAEDIDPETPLFIGVRMVR